MNIPPGADVRPILTESMFQAICAVAPWPATPQRRDGLTMWASNEDTPAWIFNPMATEYPAAGSVMRSTWSLGLPGVAPGQWNSDGAYGVGIYATEGDGARATVFTIQQKPPAFSFKPIADWIDANCFIAPDKRSALADNLGSWGTTGFAAMVRGGWEPAGMPDPPPPAPSITDELLVALFAGSEQHDANGVPLPFAQRLSYAQGRFAEIVAGTKPSVIEVAGSALSLAASKSNLAIYANVAKAFAAAQANIQGDS